MSSNASERETEREIIVGSFLIMWFGVWTEQQIEKINHGRGDAATSDDSAEMRIKSQRFNAAERRRDHHGKKQNERAPAVVESGGDGGHRLGESGQRERSRGGGAPHQAEEWNERERRSTGCDVVLLLIKNDDPKLQSVRRWHLLRRFVSLQAHLLLQILWAAFGSLPSLQNTQGGYCASFLLNKISSFVVMGFLPSS